MAKVNSLAGELSRTTRVVARNGRSTSSATTVGIPGTSSIVTPYRGDGSRPKGFVGGGVDVLVVADGLRRCRLMWNRRAQCPERHPVRCSHSPPLCPEQGGG